jgi:predicted transcriptional regulator
LRRIETRTFRIDTDTAEELDELARKDKVNVNVIANQALRKHVEYDAYAEKFGLVTISKELLETFFGLMSDEEARALGKKSGEQTGVALVSFWFKKFNMENVIRSLERIASHYNHNFKFEHNHNGQEHVLILRHDSGPRASAFYAESVKVMFALLDVKVELEESEDQVVAKLLIPEWDKLTIPDAPISVEQVQLYGYQPQRRLG